MNPEQLPTTQEYVGWVQECLRRLSMRPSHFLKDGTPGDGNRASRALAAKSIKIETQRRLAIELTEAATTKGVSLPPFLQERAE